MSFRRSRSRFGVIFGNGRWRVFLGSLILIRLGRCSRKSPTRNHRGSYQASEEITKLHKILPLDLRRDYGLSSPAFGPTGITRPSGSTKSRPNISFDPSLARRP